MTQPITIKRAICAQCLRPQRTCICRWITPIAHATEVLILQHPLEVANAKGTARLLHLSLPLSRLITGEVFAEEELHALLYAPFADTHDRKQTSAIRPLLLYPRNPGNQNAPAPFSLTSEPIETPATTRLVVLDGTWRKSRKMLALNPLLQQLPRLALHNPPASHYAIRKAHQPDQLSTLEATCHALMQLEKDEKKMTPLLAAFDGFIAQQQAQVEEKRAPD